MQVYGLSAGAALRLPGDYEAYGTVRCHHRADIAADDDRLERERLQGVLRAGESLGSDRMPSQLRLLVSCTRDMRACRSTRARRKRLIRGGPI